MNREVIEKALKELKAKLDEVKAIYSELQTLKKYGADINLPDIQNLISSNGSETGISVDVSIRPDEFFGMTNSDAAEKYLKKIGHAIPFDDIYNALVEGGIKFTSNGRTVLNNLLTRGTRRFVKMGKGHKISFGLVDFYSEKFKKQRLGQISDDPIVEKTEKEEDIAETPTGPIEENGEEQDQETNMAERTGEIAREESQENEKAE